MSSISCDGYAATRTLPDGPDGSFADIRKGFRLFAVALAEQQHQSGAQRG
jgi:hypothetical protein